MFYIGQKVRCINDRFHPSIADWADHIPVAGEVYTVRDIGSGTHAVTHLPGYGILLAELPNPVAANGHEVHFIESRFVPVEAEEFEFEAEQNGCE